jgi:hypothetical protein
VKTLIRLASASALLLLPFAAEGAGQPPLTVVCSGLAGCGKGAENVLVTSTLPTAVALLLQVAGGAAVIFMVLTGFRILIQGEEYFNSAKKLILYIIGGLGLAMTAATIVGFVSTEDFGQSNSGNFLVGGFLPSIVRIILTVFNVAFGIVIIVSGIRMVMAAGKTEEFKKAAGGIKFAIIGAVLVNLSRAIIEAFLNIKL